MILVQIVEELCCTDKIYDVKFVNAEKINLKLKLIILILNLQKIMYMSNLVWNFLDRFFGYTIKYQLYIYFRIFYLDYVKYLQ